MISKHLPDVVRCATCNEERLLVIVRGPMDRYQNNVAMQILRFFNQKELEAVLVDPDEFQHTDTVEGMLHEVETRYIPQYEHIIINNENRWLMDYNDFRKLGMASGFACFTLDLFDHRDNYEATPQDHAQLDRSYFDAPVSPAFVRAHQPSRAL